MDTFFPKLPEHVIDIIFSKLSVPVLNLPNCRLVSKSWNRYVLNSKFFSDTLFLLKEEDHIENSPKSTLHLVDLNENHMTLFSSLRFPCDWTLFEIVNSCNGLLLCVVNWVSYLVILNPMTNEFIRICKDEGSYSYGFGFNRRTEEYKIVRFRDHHQQPLEILTGGKNWLSYGSVSPFIICSTPQYYDGALYWVGKIRDDGEIFVGRLDLDVERDEDLKFELTYVTRVEDLRSGSFLVGIFNGELYVSVREFEKFEVYIFHNGEKDLWIREFVGYVPYGDENYTELVERKRVCQLIKFFGNGEILCLVRNKGLFLYNPKTGTTMRFNDDDEDDKRDFQCRFLTTAHHIQYFNFDSLQKIM